MDHKNFAQRFFRFTRFNRFLYDFLPLANTGPLLMWDKEHYKLKRLKKRKNNTWERKLRLRVKELAAKGVYRIFEKRNKLKFVKTPYKKSKFYLQNNKFGKYNRKRRGRRK